MARRAIAYRTLRQERRRQLLDAVATVIARNGHAGTRIEDAAAAERLPWLLERETDGMERDRRTVPR